MATETLERLELLRQQETNSYSVDDCLPRRPLHASSDVDISCRRKMIAWTHQVAEYSRFHRDTIETAVSFADRYIMQTPLARSDRMLYQLVVLGALYTASKVHEKRVIAPSLLVCLSRDEYSVKDITDMELQLLRVLKWRLHQPTSSMYLAEFLALIPDKVLCPAHKKVASKLTGLQVDVAVAHTASTPKYLIVLAALLNTLDTLGEELNVPNLDDYASILARSVHLSPYSLCLVQMQGSINRWTAGVAPGILPVSPVPTETKTFSRKIVRQRGDVSPRSVTIVPSFDEDDDDDDDNVTIDDILLEAACDA